MTSRPAVVSGATLEPPPGVQALLFDCDGTLVDTMGHYRAIWEHLFTARGFVMTDAWWAEFGGVPLEAFVRGALPRATGDLIADLRLQSIDLFLERIESLKPLEHVVDVVRRFSGVLPMVVCSGSFRSTVDASLRAVGIENLFAHVLTADDVVKSKPAPDLYLLALERLGMTAADVVVYEDSEIGKASAVAARIDRIIDVRDHSPWEQESPQI